MSGKVSDRSDKWAIDPTVLSNNGQLYLLWSGWPGDVNGIQNLYIARLKKPWKIQGKRVKISSPELPWECYTYAPRNAADVFINEGPEILKHDNTIFLIYSASGCWTDHYALGELSASVNADLMYPA